MMEDWILCRDYKHCTKPKYMVDSKGSCDVDDTIIGICVPRICPNYIPVRDDSTCEGFIKVNNDILKSKEENAMNVNDIFEIYLMGGSKIFKCFEGNVEITGDNPPRVSVRQKEYNALVDVVENLIKYISDITNDKEEVVKEKVRACIKVEELNDNISELSKKLVAFEAANKENKKLVERLDEKIYEKNEVIESLKKETKEQINKIEELTNALIKSNAEVNETNIRNKLLENSNDSLLKDNLEYLEENRKLHNILCENCKYDNDVDDICFRACKCGSHFCPEDSKELQEHKKCFHEQYGRVCKEKLQLTEVYSELKGKYEKLKEASDQSIVELEKLVEEKNKEIRSLNIAKEFYINKTKELAEERDELKKQNDSIFYDILDSDMLGLPHGNYLTRSNRYPIYRRNGINNMTTQDFTFVGYLYVKNVDDGENLTSKTIGEVKSWCIGEDEIYKDDTKLVKLPKHHIAIVPMRKDGIEAAEKWVIE